MLKTLFKSVDSVENGEEALALYKSNKYDIVLSDIQMPKINGVELVQEIYNINQNQMIIVLSAFDDSKYLLPLINLGIERFIKKPIDYDELTNSLLNVSKKVIENCQFNNDSIILLDNSFTFDKEKDLMYCNNDLVALTKYEIIFMQLISDNVGKVYSNDNIVAYYDSVNEKIDTENIRKLVSKLRRKIPKDSIESLYGVGYRLISINT